MSTVILNAIVAVIAIVVLFLLWGGVHLLARRRMGDRKLGCQGPSYDIHGNAVCCSSGEACEAPEVQRRREAAEQ